MTFSAGIGYAFLVLAVGLVVAALLWWRARDRARTASGVIEVREETTRLGKEALRAEAARTDAEAAAEFDRRFGGGR